MVTPPGSRNAAFGPVSPAVAIVLVVVLVLASEEASAHE